MVDIYRMKSPHAPGEMQATKQTLAQIGYMSKGGLNSSVAHLALERGEGTCPII